MYTLIEIFRESIALKFIIGIVTFICATEPITEELTEQNVTTDYTIVDIAMHKKIMEVDDAYYYAHIKTIE